MKLFNAAILLSALSLATSAMAFDEGRSVVLNKKLESTHSGKKSIDGVSSSVRRNVNEFSCVFHITQIGLVTGGSYEAGTVLNVLDVSKDVSMLSLPITGKMYAKKVFTLKAESETDKRVVITCFSDGGKDKFNELAKDVSLDEVIGSFSDLISAN